MSWKQVEQFREDPTGTMASHDASIIAVPVPIGAIDPIDKRLNTNNPISLSGSLDPISSEGAGKRNTHQVHIGDWPHATIVNGLRARFLEEDAERPELAPPLQQEQHTSNHSGKRASEDFNHLFGFSQMNHAVDYDNSRTFETNGNLINTMCFHTMQRFQNPQTGRWEVTNLNSGHFGENGVYEGAPLSPNPDSVLMLSLSQVSSGSAVGSWNISKK